MLFQPTFEVFWLKVRKKQNGKKKIFIWISLKKAILYKKKARVSKSEEVNFACGNRRSISTRKKLSQSLLSPCL